MDRIDIEVVFEKALGDENGNIQLAAQLKINDQLIADWWDIPVDMIALLESAEKNGTYFIWTCTCGIPECGNIRKGVGVTHDKEAVCWKGGSYPLENFGTLKFDRVNYIRKVQDAFREFTRLYKSYTAAKTEFELCPDLRSPELIARMQQVKFRKDEF